MLVYCAQYINELFCTPWECTIWNTTYNFLEYVFLDSDWFFKMHNYNLDSITFTREHIFFDVFFFNEVLWLLWDDSWVINNSYFQTHFRRRIFHNLFCVTDILRRILFYVFLNTIKNFHRVCYSTSRAQFYTNQLGKIRWEFSTRKIQKMHFIKVGRLQQIRFINRACLFTWHVPMSQPRKLLV